jgi:hypothetical protein
MILATGSFLASFIGIALLFSMKYRESKTGYVYFPTARDWADAKSIELKLMLMRSRTEIERLPPLAILLLRRLVHAGALSFAALARIGEEQAHRLADIVSHKHRFERREPRSEFLKQVSEHKNGGQDTGTYPEEKSTIQG